jgi:hypothetical protein
MRLILFVALLAGCEKDLLKDLPDAGTDAMPDAASAACPTPSQPLAPGNTKVYVVTDGITLAKTSGCDDSRTNCTVNVVADQTVVPPFLPGNPDRDAYIASILTKSQETFAAYSIDFVTTRPATGDYHMIVMGGDPVAVTGTCDTCASLTPADCTANKKDHLDLVFDKGEGGTANPYVYTIASDLGAMLGMAGTTVPGDCECRGNGCSVPPGTVCTFGVDVPTDPNYSCGRTTQDEPAILKDAVGCR